MHPNERLIADFYAALARRDGTAMAACYHPNVTFRDEVFDLHGERAGAMWRMLCEQGRDLTVEASDIRADDAAGSARWEARYTFSRTGRPVHNVIDAAFTFQDGLIRTHRDRFDLWSWTRQALGTPGVVLGWTPWLRGRVASEATRALDAWIGRSG